MHKQQTSTFNFLRFCRPVLTRAAREVEKTHLAHINFAALIVSAPCDCAYVMREKNSKQNHARCTMCARASPPGSAPGKCRC